MSRIGELLAGYVADDMKKKLDASVVYVKAKLKQSDKDMSDINTDWAKLGFIGKFVMNKKADYFAEYKDELAYNLEFRTRLVGLDFARQLSSELQREIGRMSDEINAFSKMLSDCIDDTNRLITAQQKVNKGLEDKSGAVIEVSEEDRMEKYEEEIRYDKEGMANICRQLREDILSGTEFKNFGDLLSKINEKTIKHAFDVKLSKIIEAKHADLPSSSTKVLGLNILTQLQQKLGRNRQKIQEFAHDVLKQSGAYIKLDGNQIISNIRNNDKPDENKNINLREVLISIPSPSDNPDLRDFANDLKEAFESQVENGVKKPQIFMESSRKNELSIITINYAFPMRAITWLAGYKKRYERYLHTGNVNQDLSRAILLHSEGLGDNLPDLFAKSDAELRKIDEEKAAAKATASNPQPTAMPGSPVPPPAPGAAVPPPMQPTEPQVQMYLNIGGQNYGPYDYATLKSFVPTGQLTPQTMVWQQGMSSWMPAGQVPELQPLFAPTPPPTAPGMPPMPPTPGTVPPPMV